jgi:hypothetical protein
MNFDGDFWIFKHLSSSWFPLLHKTMRYQWGFRYLFVFIKLDNFFWQILLQDKYNIGVLYIHFQTEHSLWTLMETFEFLNICQVHGFPRIMGVLTHLDSFKDNKRMRKTKKRLKHRFWTPFNSNQYFNMSLYC